MIIEAGRNGCLREVLIIASALSIQDPRERPADTREAADAQHARFAEPGSDFLAFLHLWDYLREQQRELSSSAFRRMCAASTCTTCGCGNGRTCTASSARPRRTSVWSPAAAATASQRATGGS